MTWAVTSASRATDKTCHSQTPYRVTDTRPHRQGGREGLTSGERQRRGQEERERRRERDEGERDRKREKEQTTGETE